MRMFANLLLIVSIYNAGCNFLRAEAPPSSTELNRARVVIPIADRSVVAIGWPRSVHWADAAIWVQQKSGELADVDIAKILGGLPPQGLDLHGTASGQRFAWICLNTHSDRIANRVFSIDPEGNVRQHPPIPTVSWIAPRLAKLIETNEGLVAICRDPCDTWEECEAADWKSEAQHFLLKSNVWREIKIRVGEAPAQELFANRDSVVAVTAEYREEGIKLRWVSSKTLAGCFDKDPQEHLVDFTPSRKQIYFGASEGAVLPFYGTEPAGDKWFLLDTANPNSAVMPVSVTQDYRIHQIAVDAANRLAIGATSTAVSPDAHATLFVGVAAPSRERIHAEIEWTRKQSVETQHWIFNEVETDFVFGEPFINWRCSAIGI